MSTSGSATATPRVLVQLATTPQQRLCMSELAARTESSKSRLSHAVACLEERGLVSRWSDTTDGRGRIARLTPAGRRFLDLTAQHHGTAAPRLVLDQLEPDEVEQLRVLTGKLLDGLPVDVGPRHARGAASAVKGRQAMSEDGEA